MGDYGARVPRVEHVDAPDELEEWRGVLGHAVVRPGRELELLHLPPVRVAHLISQRDSTGLAYVWCRKRGHKLNMNYFLRCIVTVSPLSPQ